MKKDNFLIKLFTFIYKQFFLRFSGQIRDPYLVRIDGIFLDEETNELSVSYHVANKRVSDTTSVSNFVLTDMIYLTDPRLVFDMGQQSGAYSEKIRTIKTKKTSLKDKCIKEIKRVFIDD